MKAFINFKYFIATVFTFIAISHASHAEDSTSREVSNASKGSDVQATATTIGGGCPECCKNCSKVERSAATTVKNPCFGVREGASCSSGSKSSTDSSAETGER